MYPGCMSSAWSALFYQSLALRALCCFQPLCLAQFTACRAVYMPKSDLDSLACTFEMYNEALSGLCLGAKRLVCWH